jgi:predicted oxidoreductase
MEQIKLSDTLYLSRIVQGFMRLSEWNMTKEERLNFIEQCIDIGITSFDHADIYGGYTCEELFGEALALKPELREKIQLITKCGIKLISPNRPEHRVKHYDTSKKHIIKSVDNSLKNLRTDYIDLLLIHRPDPFMNPEEVAEAFDTLYTQGKVRNFGVSNFTPSQFNMLSSYLKMPLVTNQIEISVMQYENFQNGTIDLCLEKRIPPLAWSPLAGGKVFTSDDEKSVRLRNTLEKIAKELNVDGIDKVMYAWLLNHPAKIIPIVGSGKINRVKRAVESIDIRLDKQQWFEILEASRGIRVP